MSILGDLFGVGSAVAGFFGGKSKNKQATLDAANNAKLVGNQTDQAALIAQLSKAFGEQGSGITDVYGGGSQYDPVTGTFKYNLAGAPAAIQGASNDELLARDSGDQAIRRAGLIQSDNLRQGNVGEALTARTTLDNQRAGIGLIDPGSIEASLRSGRTSAVNAGFDDAARAAGTLGIRQGADTGDALSRIAKERARTIATTMGDPYVEGLTTAEGINQGRRSQATQDYNLFDTKGGNFYDAQFNPAGYDSTATDNLFKTQAAQTDRFNASTQGLGTAAAGYGSAAAGLRAGSEAAMKNKNYGNTAQFISSLGQIASGNGFGGNSAGSLLKALGI